MRRGKRKGEKKMGDGSLRSLEDCVRVLAESASLQRYTLSFCLSVCPTPTSKWLRSAPRLLCIRLSARPSLLYPLADGFHPCETALLLRVCDNGHLRPKDPRSFRIHMTDGHIRLERIVGRQPIRPPKVLRGSESRDRKQSPGKVPNARMESRRHLRSS